MPHISGFHIVKQSPQEAARAGWATGFGERGAGGGIMAGRAVPSPTQVQSVVPQQEEASSAMPVLALGTDSQGPGWEKLQSQVVHAGP